MARKTWHPRLLECPECHVFRKAKKKVFDCVFVLFFDEGKPYFECIKAEDFRLN